MPPSSISTKRHIAPDLPKYGQLITENDVVTGVTIRGLSIETSQGSIGHEQWCHDTTEALEALAQCSSERPRRKLCLPEMVHPHAQVKLSVKENHSSTSAWQIQWTAMDALTEWASAHAQIPLEILNNRTANDEPVTAGNLQDAVKSYKGVNVLKTKDAQLWKKKHQQQFSESNDATAILPVDPTTMESMIHYDWSFSTPHCGTMIVDRASGHWRALPHSGLRMDLLMDRSVPILYFDDITLYEDDLHDNGQVQYSIKLRVMPTCAFVLARLWLRVDQVVVRCRETRVLVDLTTTNNNSTTTTNPRLHRDVTWRECAWDELATHGLPPDVRTWQLMEDRGTETPEWQSMLQKIPLVPELPEGILAHAVFVANEPR